MVCTSSQKFTRFLKYVLVKYLYIDVVALYWLFSTSRGPDMMFVAVPSSYGTV